jgi:hypothetical protein
MSGTMNLATAFAASVKDGRIKSPCIGVMANSVMPRGELFFRVNNPGNIFAATPIGKRNRPGKFIIDLPRDILLLDGRDAKIFI